MLQHLTNFIRDTSVASLAPTMPHCVTRICTAIDFSKARVIVEYGPGDGAFTEQLLSSMRPDAKLIVFETNERFARVLREGFPDNRLTVIQQSAGDVLQVLSSRGIASADYVVSGIPFSFFDEKSKAELIRDTGRLLGTEGKFIIYQALTAPAGKASLQRALLQHFTIKESYSLYLNLPPLYVFEATPSLAPEV